jgi:hypothetical protein
LNARKKLASNRWRESGLVSKPTDVEEILMHANREDRYMKIRAIASKTRQRDGNYATPEAALKVSTGLGVLIALLVASLAYVVAGGPFALEASPIYEHGTSIGEVSGVSAGVAGARLGENLSGGIAEPLLDLASSHVGRDRGSEGNVMTYEHD